MSSRADLFTELQQVAERIHVAMQTQDGRPAAFRDEVVLLLLQYESDLDVKDVFAAVLAVANRSRADALDELYKKTSGGR